MADFVMCFNILTGRERLAPPAGKAK